MSTWRIDPNHTDVLFSAKHSGEGPGSGGPNRLARPGRSSLPRPLSIGLTGAVSNSESATQDWTLADLPIGVSARVVSLDPSRQMSLASHGIRPGAIVEVEDDAPFGGPRIVHLGFARLAIARVVARTIRVRREPGDVVEASR